MSNNVARTAESDLLVSRYIICVYSHTMAAAVMLLCVAAGDHQFTDETTTLQPHGRPGITVPLLIYARCILMDGNAII